MDTPLQTLRTDRLELSQGPAVNRSICPKQFDSQYHRSRTATAKTVHIFKLEEKRFELEGLH